MFHPEGIVCKNIEELNRRIGDDYDVVTKPVYKNKKRHIIRYINLPAAIDIEASSFYASAIEYKTNAEMKELYEKIERLKEDKQKDKARDLELYAEQFKKVALMYIWQLNINGYIVYGRTWEEFDRVMRKLRWNFDLSDSRRLVFYSRNFSYEFQYFRKQFHWTDLFAREERSPMKAMTEEGIEFRCSYALAGCSLEQTGKDLVKYKAQKQVGKLDYDLIRTPLTPLTQDELDYCLYDVIVDCNYIKEEMERYEDNITKIPMTKTSKVRIRCRKECFSKENRKGYKNLIKALRINSIDEYKMLKRAFQGGFTHASWLHTNFERWHVQSKDFTSSYPTVLISEAYPMGRGEEVNITSEEDLRERAVTKLLIFNVRFTNLRPKFIYEHYLSASKCWYYNSKDEQVFMNEKTKNVKCDNGRIISAPELFTTITNVDYDIICKFYDFDTVDFGKGYEYIKGYLPTPFVKVILGLYEGKTKLKDVPGMEGEYQLEKGDLNGCYGMTVTDIVNDEIKYEMDQWESVEGNEDEQLNRYNDSKTRFLYYPWGVFCTAYARRNVTSGILELGKDYIYCDTDSVKYINGEDHVDYFTNYNKWITMKLEEACKYHKINPEMVKPKTKDGVEKPLGVWDDEGCETPEGHLYARRFKTLGAKRYLIEYWDKKEQKWQLKCTIAGVNKKKTSKWFMSDYEHAFSKFEDFMEVPEDSSGRLIASYIDPEDMIECDVKDYNGQAYHVEPHTGIHMEKSAYNLTMTPIYLALLNGREDEVTC